MISGAVNTHKGSTHIRTQHAQHTSGLNTRKGPNAHRGSTRLRAQIVLWTNERTDDLVDLGLHVYMGGDDRLTGPGSDVIIAYPYFGVYSCRRKRNRNSSTALFSMIGWWWGGFPPSGLNKRQSVFVIEGGRSVDFSFTFLLFYNSWIRNWRLLCPTLDFLCPGLNQRQ